MDEEDGLDDGGAYSSSMAQASHSYPNSSIPVPFSSYAHSSYPRQPSSSARSAHEEASALRSGFAPLGAAASSWYDARRTLGAYASENEFEDEDMDGDAPMARSQFFGASSALSAGDGARFHALAAGSPGPRESYASDTDDELGGESRMRTADSASRPGNPVARYLDEAALDDAASCSRSRAGSGWSSSESVSGLPTASSHGGVPSPTSIFYSSSRKHHHASSAKNYSPGAPASSSAPALHKRTKTDSPVSSYAQGSPPSSPELRMFTRPPQPAPQPLPWNFSNTAGAVTPSSSMLGWAGLTSSTYMGSPPASTAGGAATPVSLRSPTRQRYVGGPIPRAPEQQLQQPASHEQQHPSASGFHHSLQHQRSMSSSSLSPQPGILSHLTPPVIFQPQQVPAPPQFGFGDAGGASSPPSVSFHALNPSHASSAHVPSPDFGAAAAGAPSFARAALAPSSYSAPQQPPLLPGQPAPPHRYQAGSPPTLEREVGGEVSPLREVIHRFTLAE